MSPVESHGGSRSARLGRERRATKDPSASGHQRALGAAVWRFAIGPKTVHHPSRGTGETGPRPDCSGAPKSTLATPGVEAEQAVVGVASVTEVPMQTFT
jgi:hypothetical protein